MGPSGTTFPGLLSQEVYSPKPLQCCVYLSKQKMKNFSLLFFFEKNAIRKSSDGKILRLLRKVKAKADGSPWSNQARTMLQSFPSAYPPSSLSPFSPFRPPVTWRRIFQKHREHNSQAHTARIFLSHSTQTSFREKSFFFFVLFCAGENTKNTFFHPFVKWHAHRPEMWHRTKLSPHHLIPPTNPLSKSLENAKHYQRKEFSSLPTILLQ